MKLKSVSLLIVLATILSLSSCISMLQSPTYSEYDEVKGIDRSRKTIVYLMPQEWLTPHRSLQQTLLKQQNDARFSLKMYDELILSDRHASLEDTVYYLINNKVFPIYIDKIDVITEENFQTTSRTEEDIDDNSIEVTTNHTNEVVYNYRLEYVIPEELLDEMLKAKSLRFRYYSGPYMMTYKLKGSGYKSLKRYLLN